MASRRLTAWAVHPARRAQARIESQVSPAMIRQATTVIFGSPVKKVRAIRMTSHRNWAADKTRSGASQSSGSNRSTGWVALLA
jgi:hypothetical protein